MIRPEVKAQNIKLHTQHFLGHC